MRRPSGREAALVDALLLGFALVVDGARGVRRMLALLEEERAREAAARIAVEDRWGR